MTFPKLLLALALSAFVFMLIWDADQPLRDCMAADYSESECLYAFR